jgi:cellulose synthase/poly-beta-1,6-N-acetylglucosamine synthase-like glycosyltransferase
MRVDGEAVDSVGQVLKRWNLEVLDRGHDQSPGPELMRRSPVLAACGALAVFRRQALASVADEHGPWAQHFFCFWEDLELGWRLHNAGWRVESCPQAVATHRRGAGAAAGRGPLRWRRPPALEACVLSNRWMTLIRHLHPLDLLTRLPLLLLWDPALVAAGAVRRPSLLGHLRRRWPMVMREWRNRSRYRRRRLHELV